MGGGLEFSKGLGPREATVLRTASEWIDDKVGLRSSGGSEPLVRKGDTIGMYLVERVCFIGRGPGSDVTSWWEQ